MHIMKTILTTASVIALMAGSAFAQDTTMPKPTTTPAAQAEEMAPAKTAAYSGEMSVNDLINKSVKNANNETVGDINDIRIGADGNIAAVIVGVGGFLGLGEKNVALPYEQLSFTRDGDGGLLVTANVTKDSLQTAPEWKKSDDRS
jgi:sporulation protein YlmC with PRC-barrel domain